jgi:isocitrate lyase
MRPMTTPCCAPDGTGGAVPPQDPNRFAGIRRDYTDADVARLAGSFRVRHTLAENGARRGCGICCGRSPM